MVDFAHLQEILRDRLEQDRAVQFVEVTGPTLEAAISDAAALLNIPTRRTEYEIMEKGSPGFIGIGKKEWRIQAYSKIIVERKKAGDELLEENLGEMGPVIEDRDGEVYVHLSPNGDVMLKATAPSGNGRRASEIYAIKYLDDRKAKNVDKGLTVKTVRESQGVYVKVGSYEHHTYNDSIVRTEIIEGEMQAFIQVTPPGEGGSDISFDLFIDILKKNKIVSGIKDDFLYEFIDKPTYNERLLVAEGTKAKDGNDAYIEFYFETDQSKVRLKEGSNGKIDFKELNIIQNVTENQPLAKRIHAEQGVPGETVTGRYISASNGKDTTLPVGTNVHVDTDGDTILADINGQALMINNVVNVEPVFTVNGDVNLKTGNVVFLGTVVVTGNVEDGFSVKAEGNIEVRGIVARAELEAEGDIIINQGINGKGGGQIRAGKSLWARFIENAHIKAGDMVIVSDGIINSYIDAGNRIICQGKRASIKGGRLRAGEEINAKILGNPAGGTETICEVGFDPKSKEELDRLQQEKSVLEKQLEEANRNITSLVNIKKQRKTLPEEKEAALQEMMDNRDGLTKVLNKTGESILGIQAFLNNLKTRGRISASTKVYPGVKIVIRDSIDDVRTEYKAATFILENGLIRVTKYEEPDESTKKGPDGHSTN
ncbi:MAG: FapA family protein [Treponema sp.]|nr:FapA family protein [Treponema sp.]